MFDNLATWVLIGFVLAANPMLLTCGGVVTRTGEEMEKIDRGIFGIQQHGPVQTCKHEYARRWLDVTNEARSEHGAGELECDDSLSTLAYRHAVDMCRRGYRGHTTPDGRDFADRVAAAGIERQRMAENITYNQYKPENAHRVLMSSSGHRENILDEDFTEVGFGAVACGEDPRWVQVFR